ncbi:MAG: hypothetical protein WCH43_06740 [Verrucomicrobiota bacterium]
MKTLSKSIFISLLVMILPIGASAQVEWSGAGNDSAWQNAANWSGGKAPKASDQVVIATSGGKVLMTGNDNAASGFKMEKDVSLTIQPQASFQLVKGGSNPDGISFVAEGSKITVLGMLRMNQAIYFTDGTITVTGSGSVEKDSDDTSLAFLQANNGVFTLNLEGDKARIANLLILGGPTQLNINLTLGPGGMNPIEVNILECGDGSTLTVDVSKYEGTKGTVLKLITFNAAKGKFANLKVVGGTAQIHCLEDAITLDNIVVKL